MKALIAGFIVVFLLWAVPAQAAPQTVNLNTATFAWAPGVPDATHTAAVSFNVKCGTATGGPYTAIWNVGATSTTLPVISIEPAPGTWFCVVTAVNAFGESPPSNEINIQTGFGPPKVVNAQVNP